MHVIRNDDEAEIQFFTRDEVAALARTTRARIRYWDRKGLLPSVRPSGTRMVLYPREQILAWLHGNWPPRLLGGRRP
jgi:MerR HTH family regulatory protein